MIEDGTTTPAGGRRGPLDPGLQAERTSLAWSRTGLAVFVNAALALRTGAASGRVHITVLGIVLMFAAGATVLFGAMRARHLLHAPELAAPPYWMLVVTVAVTWLACLTELLAMLGD